jgi:hypothetical protein
MSEKKKNGRRGNERGKKEEGRVKMKGRDNRSEDIRVPLQRAVAFGPHCKLYL